mmetsp:Transcript_1663/g.5793  ORF Transcript_1663/g.5793 Transcript_1663/m.5793 type:complete len:957 (-) Transcript_1663:6694-9564(-)
MTIVITDTEKARQPSESRSAVSSHNASSNQAANSSSSSTLFYKIKLLELRHLSSSCNVTTKKSPKILNVHVHSPYLIIIVSKSIFVYSLLSINHWEPHSSPERLLEDKGSSSPEPMLHLKTHQSPITCSFIFTNQKFKTILLSCCEKRIIMWNIDLIANRELTKGTILGQDLGVVLALDVQQEHNVLAVALDDCVLILDMTQMKMRVQIQAVNPVTDVRFLNADFATLHTDEETTLGKELCIVERDGTITIWNWDSAECLWRSPIETGFGFMQHSLTTDLINKRRVALACGDGVAKIYEYSRQLLNSQAQNQTKRPFLRHLHSLPEMFKVYSKYFEIDILVRDRKSTNKQFKVVSAEPIWKQQNDFLKEIFSSNPLDTSNMDELKSQLNVIIALKHIVCCGLSVLCVGTPRAIFFFDMQSYDVLYIIDQGEERQAQSYDFATSGEELVHVYSAYATSVNILDIDFRRVLNDLSSVFTSGDNSREKTPPLHEEISFSSEENSFGESPPRSTSSPSSDISIFATRKLPSKLSVEFTKSNKSKHDSKGKLGLIKVKDKPVTFHTKIKSSGYGSQKPYSVAAKSKAAFSKRNSSTSSSNSHIQSPKPYPIDSDPPTRDTGLRKLVHNAPVFSLRLSYDGSRLATCSSDHSARVFRFPLSKSEASCFMSHTNAVTDVRWSFSKKLLLTSSTDCKAILWSVSRAEPLLPFVQVKHNYVSQEKLKHKTDAPIFKHAVKNAQFFYLDKFVALCTSNHFLLYKYHIAHSEKDQILQKGFNRNKYKLLLNHKSEAQTFTCASCVNSFMSPLVFLGGSNKSLQVFDVTKEKLVKCVDDAHSRPISRIILNEQPAANQSTVAQPHHMFATQASDESIRLWDLRSSRCVRQFNSHKNSVQSIGASFSPCMRFFATGSEDRCAYVYDLGSGSVISKLQGHSDVVSDVVFHPSRPMLLTSSFDNCVKVFSV